MSKQLDRARERMRKLVQQHGRLSAKKDKLVNDLSKTQSKLIVSERIIGRAQRRINKLMAAATYTSGPTASPVEELVEKLRF